MLVAWIIELPCCEKNDATVTLTSCFASLARGVFDVETVGQDLHWLGRFDCYSWIGGAGSIVREWEEVVILGAVNHWLTRFDLWQVAQVVERGPDRNSPYHVVAHQQASVDDPLALAEYANVLVVSQLVRQVL